MSSPANILESDYYERILRLIRLVRSIDGWREDPRLKEANAFLVDAKKRAELRHVERAFRSRCHASHGGLVNMYATMSGRPPTHENPYERGSRHNVLL
jgi:hypothetical protein